jgi:cytochrome d ubiquinol oxidase subunit I
MEGNWETGPRVPLLLFAIPDEEARENRFEIGIPAAPPDPQARY